MTSVLFSITGRGEMSQRGRRPTMANFREQRLFLMPLSAPLPTLLSLSPPVSLAPTMANFREQRLFLMPLSAPLPTLLSLSPPVSLAPTMANSRESGLSLMARSAPLPTLLSSPPPVALRRLLRILASPSLSLTETVHSSDYFVRYHSRNDD